MTDDTKELLTLAAKACGHAVTIDTSPAALRKLSDEYLGDYEDTKVMRDTLLAIAAEKEAQQPVADVPVHPREGPPADVPLPEPDRVDDRASESAWSQSLMHQYAEAYAKAAVAAEREMPEALELIAAPKRPDGTWNRDREACRQLAAEALGRYDEKQKGM